MIVEYAYLLLSALKLYRGRERFVRLAEQKRDAQRAAEIARRDRYASWSCPDCGRKFGPTVQYVNYAADHIVASSRGQFTRHVIITCKYCRLLNVYDPTGAALFERGERAGDRLAL